MNTHQRWDQPNPNPKRRRPFEQLLAELAERNGVPVWPVTSWWGGWNPSERAIPDFQPRYTSAVES
jgi:hypothetical protein